MDESYTGPTAQRLGFVWVSKVGSFPKPNQVIFVNVVIKPPSIHTIDNGMFHLPWKLDFGARTDVMPKLIVFQCTKSECQFWPLSQMLVIPDCILYKENEATCSQMC